MTADEAIRIVKSKSNGRTRYENQEPFLDEVLVAEIERLRAIVDQLPTDAEGTVYPPPKALKGTCFYHPDYVGPGALLFSQLFWNSDGYWGISSGGHEVPFAECFTTSKAAEEKERNR